MPQRFSRFPRYLTGCAIAAATVISPYAHSATSAAYFPWIMDPGRSTTWNFIHDNCIAPAQGKPVDKSCVQVTTDYVIDKPTDGPAHFRVMPTVPITGIEDSQLWVLAGPNYWKVGLDYKPNVEKAISPTFKFQEAQYGMALNSIFHRSQDQLHIHLDCIHPSATDKLHSYAKTYANQLNSKTWTTLPEIKGEVFRARLIDDADLSQTDPFRVLANDVLPEGMMLPQTLFVTDITVNGKKSLIMLNGSASEAAQAGQDISDGARGAGELLLDTECRLAKKS